MIGRPCNVMVVAAENWFGSTTFGLSQGFSRLGWEVHNVDPAAYLMGCDSRALKALSRLVNPLCIADYNRSLLRVVEKVRPAVFLTVKGSYVTRATLDRINGLRVKTVNYYPDFHFSYPFLDSRTFPLYSLFVTTKSFQIDYLNRLLGADKVRFLHHGYSSDAHQCIACAQGIESWQNDLLYVGTYTASKAKALCTIRERLPHLSMAVYGSGWSSASDNAHLSSHIAGYPIFGLTYATAVRSAKINLAFHMGVHGNSGWEDIVSTRTFEIPACRGFMLHVDSSEVRDLYRVGEEIDVFSDISDLVDKIRYYVDKPELRAAMLERAYRRCVPAYSYDRRAEELQQWF